MRKRNWIAVRSLGLLAFFSACSSPYSFRLAENGSAGGKIALSLVVASADSTVELGSATESVTAGLSAYANGVGLESLKLFITSVQLCEDEGATDCLALYTNTSENAPLIESLDVATALAAADQVSQGYIDVMDSTSRAEITREISLSAGDVRTYSYVQVSWATPIKVNATLVAPADGSTPILYTKRTSPGSCTVENGSAYACAIAVANLANPPSDVATFAASSREIYKLHSPLVVTESDATSESQIALKLVFNPHGLLQGVYSPGGINRPPMTDSLIADGINLGNTLSLVGAQMAAVHSRSSLQVKRESYVASLAKAGGGVFTLRLELYSDAVDPSRTIHGVALAVLPGSGMTGFLANPSLVHGISTANDGTLILSDSAGATLISSFSRGSKVGDTIQAALTCDPQNMSCAADETVQATFTLQSLETLE